MLVFSHMPQTGQVFSLVTSGSQWCNKLVCTVESQLVVMFIAAVVIVFLVERL